MNDIIEKILIDDKPFDRLAAKKSITGQKLNRLERVLSFLKLYKKDHGHPDSNIIGLAAIAVLDKDYMAEFLKLMPTKVPYLKRKSNHFHISQEQQGGDKIY